MPSLLVKYDDLDITENVIDIQFVDNSRLNIGVVPGRHGGILDGQAVRDTVPLVFTGRLHGSTAAALRALVDTLGLTFNRTNKKFRIWDDRYINAYKASFVWKYVPGSSMRVAEFQIELRCVDPFWYSDTASSTTRNLTNGDTSVGGGLFKESFTFTNNGNQIIYPKITVLANGANLTSITVRNVTKSKSWVYTGATVNNGQSLVVDQENFTVKNNGVDDLAHWNGDFVGMDPGNNTVEVEGSVPADYTFEWLERWNTP